MAYNVRTQAEADEINRKRQSKIINEVMQKDAYVTFEAYYVFCFGSKVKLLSGVSLNLVISIADMRSMPKM
jgi:hypothetical protein